MIELTDQQIQALEHPEDTPPRLVNPRTKETFVLLRVDEYERLKGDESVIFLALAGEKAVGFVQLYPCFSSTAMKRMWILNDLFVTPEARRGGAAKALMERARQWAVETKADGLWLETAVDNHPAQRLYESLGWKRDNDYYRYLMPL